jgi:hypothetical protein
VWVGRCRVAQRNVRLRQAQVVLECIGMPLGQTLEQLDADLRVAVPEQAGGGNDVQRPEQPGGGAPAEFRVDLATAPRRLLDVHNLGGTQEAFLLDQPAGDRGARKQVAGGVLGILMHRFVRVFAICRGVLMHGDQRLEGVGDRQGVVALGGGLDLRVDRRAPARTRRCQADEQQQQGALPGGEPARHATCHNRRGPRRSQRCSHG